MLSSYLLLAITLLVGIFQIEKLFPEKFKAKPWIIFGLLVVLTVVSFINEHEKNKAEEIAKQNAKNDADRRDHLIDSTANARVDSSNKVILNGIGQAIGKYSLGYDSAKQEIVVLQKLIKDSANRKTTVIQGENPTVTFTLNHGILFDSIKGDSLNLIVKLTSYSAASILKKAIIYIVISDSFSLYGLPGLHYVNKGLFASKDFRMTKDGTFYRKFGFTNKNVKELKTIYILLTGNYTDSYGKNVQEINVVSYLDLTTKESYLLGSPYDDQIRNFLKRNGLLK